MPNDPEEEPAPAVELPPSRRALEIEVDDLRKENARMRGDLDKLMLRSFPGADVIDDEDDEDDDIDDPDDVDGFLS